VIQALDIISHGSLAGDVLLVYWFVKEQEVKHCPEINNLHQR
jgi:hypothetical protein